MNGSKTSLRPLRDSQLLSDRETFTSGLLRLYLFYRFFLSLLLLGIFAAQIAPETFGNQDPELYFSLTILYVVLTVITLGFYQLQNHRLREQQLLLALLSDVLIQTVLMFASGGLTSGIGYLLLVTVAVGSVFYTGQLALFIAAVASISLMVESIIARWFYGQSVNELFPAGVLGVFLFFTSLLFLRLQRALIEAQSLARSESAISAGLQELNQLVLDRIRTGLIVTDEKGVIQQINSAARELLGRKSNNRVYAIGDSIRNERRLLKRLLQWRKWPSKTTKPFIPRFGNTELQCSFANLDQGEQRHTIIFMEDFRAAAQQAQQLKLASLGRLTGSIAHEIRNPLGAISHASELLAERSDENKTTTRLTEIIQTQVKRVNHIVESVLELSRKQNHNMEKIDIKPWLHHFIDVYLQGIPNPPDIELALPEHHPVWVVFDPVHLQQILTNLLDNALRYSQEATGKPWAKIALAGDAKQSIEVTLDVEDSGPGVPPKDRRLLFEPFFTTSSGGSGLGLYIARELCTINFATIQYQPLKEGRPGFFRITFVHPLKKLNLAEADRE